MDQLDVYAGARNPSQASSFGSNNVARVLQRVQLPSQGAGSESWRSHRLAAMWAASCLPPQPPPQSCENGARDVDSSCLAGAMRGIWFLCSWFAKCASTANPQRDRHLDKPVACSSCRSFPQPRRARIVSAVLPSAMTSPVGSGRCNKAHSKAGRQGSPESGTDQARPGGGGVRQEGSEHDPWVALGNPCCRQSTLVLFPGPATMRSLPRGRALIDIPDCCPQPHPLHSTAQRQREAQVES